MTYPKYMHCSRTVLIAGHAISQGQEATGVSCLIRNYFCEKQHKMKCALLVQIQSGNFQCKLKLRLRLRGTNSDQWLSLCPKLLSPRATVMWTNRQCAKPRSLEGPAVSNTRQDDVQGPSDSETNEILGSDVSELFSRGQCSPQTVSTSDF